METNTVFQRRVLTNGWIRNPKPCNLPSKRYADGHVIVGEKEVAV